MDEKEFDQKYMGDKRLDFAILQEPNVITFNWHEPMQIGEVVPFSMGEDKKHTRAKVIKCEYDKEIKMYKITFELGTPLSFPPSHCAISSRGK